MSARTLTLASDRKSFRATDMLGMAAGALLLVVLLSAAFAILPALKAPVRKPTPAEIQENARKTAEANALAHRQGRILFVDPDSCEEHSFDNWTGNVAYKEKVDCDAQLAKLRNSEPERTAERIRSVLEGFRR